MEELDRSTKNSGVTRKLKILFVLLVLLRFVAGVKAAYNAADNAADPAYASGWLPGRNGGTGFGAWSFDKDPGQYTIDSSPGIDVSNQSWAVTAEYGTSAIRPFAGGNLAAGQTVRAAWTLPGTNAANSQIRLLDSANNPIIIVLLNGGYLGVATNNVWGPGASVPWATNGTSLQAALNLTDTNALSLTVFSGANSAGLTNLVFTGSISAVALFVDGANNTNLPDKTAFFNSLSVSGGLNQAAPPVFNPNGGSLTNGQLISISTTTPGATIRYTLDGSNPGATTGTVYSGPLSPQLTRPLTINAIAYQTGLADSPVTSATFNPPAAMAVGNNLDGVADWSTAWPFADVFKRTRTWMTRNLDGSGAWDSGYSAQIPVDTNGWPTRVPFTVNGTNQMVHTILVNLDEPGVYNLIYEGTGSLLFGWSPGSTANLTATGGGQTFSFNVTATNTSAWLEIHSSAAADYLRNIHLVLTNHLATYATQPFHPLFLQRLQPFHCLRFMDWGAMNGSPLAAWTNRTTPGYYTQANPNGVALEHMIQLCNTLQKDAWICVPHLADDNYVQQTAQLLRDNLIPYLKIYIEYSNETWNGQFPQTAYVQIQGVNRNLDTNAYTAGQKFVALRSAQIWNIFSQAFGSAASTRLVKVLATQSANIAVTEARLAGLMDPNLNPTAVMPDALAIAPYFGTAFTPANLPPNAPYPTVDFVLTNLAVQSIAAQQYQVSAQKAIADAYGWLVVGYEGGQTFQGINGAENDTNLTAILTAANRDPRMFDRYTEYLNLLRAQGMSLFENFAYCSAWSKWGSWGSLEYQDQPTNQAPKYAALVQWIAANPAASAPVTLAAVATNNAIRLTYGPVAGGNNYTVLTNTNLTGGGWRPPVTFAGWQTNGNQISVTDNDANRAQKFYRLQISPP